MRLKNSLYNSLTSVFTSILNIIIGLVVNKLFLKCLGTEYLGLNGLFTNIISMLSIVELGIGSAIIFSLYEPIAKNKLEEVKSLMKFYKECYEKIAVTILIIGLLIVPFLKYIIKDYNLPINMYVVYLLFLSESVLSYLLSYKRSIIYANQKSYIINIIHLLYVVIMNSISIALLYMTNNYYIYLIIKLTMKFVENIIISLVANKIYPYLKEKNAQIIDEKVHKEIIKKVKALLLHKISGFFVSSTDNIIISSFIGLTQVGLYSNYFMIINSCMSIAGQFLSSLTASVGNLLVENDKEKSLDIYNKIKFLNFTIALIISMGLLGAINDFIALWIGEEYLFNKTMIIILVIKYFYEQIRTVNGVFKEAAGICYEDRFVPMIESIVNLVVSLVLVKIIGFPGVFIGTIVSTMVLHLYSYPKYVFKKLFDKPYKEYYKLFLEQTVIFICTGILMLIFGNAIVFNNNWLNLIIHSILSLITTIIVIVLIYHRTDEYKYFKKLSINVLNKFVVKYK